MIGGMHEQFKGYCFLKDGTYMPAVHLNGPEEAVRYAKLQKCLFHEVRIIGEDDKIVLQVVDGQVVFPKRE